MLHKKHSNVNGEEEYCECTFLLVWLHGPNVGNLACKGVANICLLQVSELQPKLASFMEIALQKIEKALCKSVPVAQPEENNGSPIVTQKPSFDSHLRQVLFCL